MTVSGVIEDSDNVVYWAQYSSGEELSYLFTYSNGEVMGIVTTGAEVSFEATATASGNTLAVEFEAFGEGSSNIELYGYASLWTETEGQGGEAWLDYVPGSYAPWYGSGDGGNGGSSGGTPGFETITLIAAIGIALIILRIKRK